MAGATGQRASKIVYRGDDDNEFFVIANPGMASKWRKDKSIPIVEVLQSFDILTTTTGSETGKVMRPSKGALERAFHTTDQQAVIEQIIEHGEEKRMQ